MDINAMARELMRDEGDAPEYRKVYVDSRSDAPNAWTDPCGKKGIPTIGFGRNLSSVGLSRDEALHLLYNDIENAVTDLRHSLPWVDRLDDVRFRVLVNMTFNMGIDRLLKFRKTLALTEAGRYAEAAEEMLASAWAIQTGPRAKRLSEMLRTGEAR